MVAFDPYVDMTLYPTANLSSLSQQTGVKTFNLAFITAEGFNSPIPAWGGYASYAVSTGYLKDQINTLRASGGDAIFGFGGASGTEIAQASTSVSAIQSAYQSVIDTYGATKLNFDIEGAAINDQISNQRRDQALASLQQQYAAKGTNLSITFTLPVLPTGLTNDGITLVQDALKAGVKVDTINVMAMDYGDYAAPPTQATMGAYAIQSAKSTEAQLKTIYQNAGVTLTDS
jgi:chitinase